MGDRVVAIFAQRLVIANDAHMTCQLVLVASLAFHAKFHLCIVVWSWNVDASFVSSKVVFELSFFGLGNVVVERVVVFVIVGIVLLSNLDRLE